MPNRIECEEAVIDRIIERRDRGRVKYGKTMERTDLVETEWLRHAQEEALDLAIYLERIMRDRVESQETVTPRPCDRCGKDGVERREA